MARYADDRQWSDRFLHYVKAAIGQVFITEDEEEDIKRNTDLVVHPLRVSVRIRKYADLKYKDEFTIRSHRPSGAKTELAKILEGWGDVIFFGFEGKGGGLGPWRIGCLDIFREWWKTFDRPPGKVMWNPDRSSAFRVFRWDALPPEFVIATGAGFIRD